MRDAPPSRRCTECGAPQQMIRTTIDYRESGLDNVELVDAPVWECGEGHREIQIPNAEQLHGLLTNLLIRKPTALKGTEIRFLRKELGLSGREFARRLGMTPEHLSRLETGRRGVTSTIDLLVRLAVAWELTRRRQIEFRPMLNRSLPDWAPRRTLRTTACNTATMRRGIGTGCRSRRDSIGSRPERGSVEPLGAARSKPLMKGSGICTRSVRRRRGLRIDGRPRAPDRSSAGGSRARSLSSRRCSWALHFHAPDVRPRSRLPRTGPRDRCLHRGPMRTQSACARMRHWSIWSRFFVRVDARTAINCGSAPASGSGSDGAAGPTLRRNACATAPMIA